jgi:predicted Zn-dependent protease
MKKIILNISFLLLLVSLSAQTINLDLDYYKALSYLHKNSTDSALMTINNSKSTVQNNLLKAEILYNTGDFNNAILILKKLNNNLPKETSLLLSRIYANMEFADEACFWLNEYFKYKNPIYYPELLSHREFEHINRTSEWREFWKETRYSKKEEKLSEVEYLLKNENYFSAIDLLNSENFGSHEYKKQYLLAKSYFNLKDYKNANSYLNNSLKSQPKFIEAIELKYELNLIENNHAEAFKQAQNLISLRPENPENLKKYSQACFLTNKFSEALYYINIYCEIFPDNLEALFLKAQIYIADKDYKNALLILNQLVLLNPGEKDYFIATADIYYNLESWKFARDNYSMALDIDPYLPEILFKTANCWHNMGFDDKACIYWQKAADKRHREAAKLIYRYCK